MSEQPSTGVQRPSWLPEPPRELSEEFYRAASHIADIDTGMWLYLLDLIPEDGASYPERIKLMLAGVSPCLRRYFLVRQFDWERGSGGLESCLMRDDNGMLLEDTIAAFESLGCRKHAEIIRGLMPLAADRMRRIREAEVRGVEFDFDDGFWKPWEARYQRAGGGFVTKIWKEIKAHPERYVHKRAFAQLVAVANGSAAKPAQILGVAEKPTTPKTRLAANMRSHLRMLQSGRTPSVS
jgi:hypothetical protein